MTPIADTDGASTPKAALAAVMTLFFLSGTGFALWGVHLPLVKARFLLSDAELSWLLFALAFGAMLAMTPIGRLVERFGSARICGVAGLAYVLVLAALWHVPAYAGLLVALAVAGAASSSLDVAMNAQAVALERRRQRPVMSRMHGMFSAGGIVGALFGNAALAHGWPPERTFAVFAGIATAALFTVRASLLPDAAPEPGAVVSSPTDAARRRLWLLGSLAVLGMIAEGAMYDWSSVYMHDVLRAPLTWLGAGYAGFSAGMTGARFGGDVLRARLGGGRLLRWSAALCVASIALLCLWPILPAAIAGYAMMGIGCANLVPVLFAEAAGLNGVAVAAGIAYVGRMAYLGILLGPVLVGFVSARLGLLAAFWVLAICCATIGVGARRALGAR